MRPITKMPHESIGSARALLPTPRLDFAASSWAETSILAVSAREERIVIRQQGHVSVLQVDSQLLSRLGWMQYGDSQNRGPVTTGCRDGKPASQDTISLRRTRTSILLTQMMIPMVDGRVCLGGWPSVSRKTHKIVPQKSLEAVVSVLRRCSHRPRTLRTGETSQHPMPTPHPGTTVVMVSAALRIPRALVPHRVSVA